MAKRDDLMDQIKDGKGIPPVNNGGKVKDEVGITTGLRGEKSGTNVKK